MNIDIEKRLNEHEAAALIGLSVHTLRKDRCVPSLQIPYRKLGKRILYRYADLLRWLEANEKVVIEAPSESLK